MNLRYLVMHRILSLLFTFSTIYALGQTDSEYQLLWEVKAKGAKKSSYIFGSMHSNDARLFQFPDSLYSAFVQADAVVLETDLTEIYDQYDVRINLLNFQLFQDEDSYTASRNATKTVYGSEDGRPQFLDAYFQQTGYCAEKKFYPLESVDDQLELASKLEFFDALSLPGMLVSKERFMQTYIKGDIATLTGFLKSQFKNSPKTYDELITKRNKIMANGLDTLMRKQAVFCAIGSGHLYGADGVLQLLRAKGFHVRPVKATFNEYAQLDKAKMLSWKSYNVVDTTYEFEMVFSGKPKELTVEGCQKRHLILQELGQGNTYELIIREDANYLDDQRSTFQIKQNVQVVESNPFDDAISIYGLVNDPLKGYQWKYILQVGDIAYELICTGGNKFMHSNRPKSFVDKFQYQGH